MAFCFHRAAIKGVFVAARVLKKNLSEVLISKVPRRARSPGWGRGDNKGGAGVSPAAASAAPIYDFYDSRSSGRICDTPLPHGLS